MLKREKKHVWFFICFLNAYESGVRKALCPMVNGLKGKRKVYIEYYYPI